MKKDNIIRKALDSIKGLINRSPLRFIIRGDHALLEFTSRRSGDYCSKLIRVLGHDKFIHAFCEKNKEWWKNLRNGAPVKIVLNGERFNGWAEVIEDKGHMIKEWKNILQNLTREGDPLILDRMDQLVMITVQIT